MIRWKCDSKANQDEMNNSVILVNVSVNLVESPFTDKGWIENYKKKKNNIYIYIYMQNEKKNDIRVIKALHEGVEYRATEHKIH